MKELVEAFVEAGGFVYLVLYENGTCKIGKTSASIKKRVNALDGASPLKIIGCIYRKVSNPFHVESYFQEKFREKHYKHEFFKLTEEDIQFFIEAEIPEKYSDIQVVNAGRAAKENIRLKRMRRYTEILGGKDEYKKFERVCREEHRNLSQPGLKLSAFMEQKISEIQRWEK